MQQIFTTSSISTLNSSSSSNITLQIESLDFEGTPQEYKSLEQVLSKYNRTIVKTYPCDLSTLIDLGHHPFVGSAYLAYAEHRPLILSPDMIWLVITQGFSFHINVLAKQGKPLFPHLKNKETLTFESNEKLNVEGMTDFFTNQLREKVDAILVDTLIADFSTTGVTEKIVSQATTMNTFKAYFEYVYLYCICGIPSITLEGTASDWQNLYDKTAQLKGYEIDDWIDNILPLLQRFIDAFKGNVDVNFWRNFFKIHTTEEYGHPKNIDGWITHFFPYHKNGFRMNFGEVSSFNIEKVFEKLPPQIVSVDFKHITVNDSNATITAKDMEIHAGFIGAIEKENYAIRPEIGWFISDRPKKQYNIDESKKFGGLFFNNLNEFPKVLLELDDMEMNCLLLAFNDTIQIPDEITQLKVFTVHLQGKTTPEEIKRIAALCRKMECYDSLSINDVDIPLWEESE